MEKITKENILKEIATTLKLDLNELNENMRFKEDLKQDSIDLVEILMDVEEKFEIEIPDEKAVNIKTIGDFINTVLEENNA